MANEIQEFARKLINLVLAHPQAGEDFRGDVAAVTSIYLPSSENFEDPWTVQGFVVRFRDGTQFRVAIEHHEPGGDDRA